MKLFLPLISSIFTFSIISCTAPMKQEIDLAKLKDSERAYKGNIQVDLNGMRNDQLTCDLFLNIDLSPTIRLSPSGDYQFKSMRKKLGFTKIACIYSVENKKHWIYQKLDLERISQPEDSTSFYDMGTFDIVWTVKDSEFEEDTSLSVEKDKMRSIGKIKVTHKKAEQKKNP